ncbi:chaplin family protein [Streptomyces erythrochromogenes]
MFERKGNTQASGNPGRIPVHAPVNACDPTANLAGAPNPAFGSAHVNA